MKQISSRLSDLPLNDKKIFLRADLNVPLDHGTIIEDYRLQQLRPTLDYILDHGGRVIIGTHIGRPKNQNKQLSTQVLIPWFTEHGYDVTFAATPEEAHQLLENNRIVLLDNLRFFPEEQQPSSDFAHALKGNTEIYVNDAFGTLHREDTSVSMLPLLYEEAQRSIGLLIEKEITALNQVISHPDKPVVMILGGGKVYDKLELLKHLQDSVDTALVCPALTFTFMQSLGYSVGASLVDQQASRQLCTFMHEAEEHHLELILPSDCLVEENGTLSIHQLDEIPENGFGLSIGPDTVDAWKSIIEQAGTIIVNGLSGMSNRSETTEYFRQLLQIVSTSSAYSVIAGGDAGMAALTLGSDKFDYISTGGGSALAYLSGKSLPGLKPF